jgi:RNA polymerase sigma factor (sigma-70 family)
MLNLKCQHETDYICFLCCVQHKTRNAYNIIQEHITDEQVLKEILNGETGYYEILYHRYREKVLDKCYSILKDRQLAVEFTQDIFSKVYEKLNGFKGKSSFSSWLYAITYNHCIEYLRHKKKLHYPEWNRNHELPELIDEIDESFLQEIRFERLMKILERSIRKKRLCY